MDHNEAIKLRAAERYALGELPEQVRDAYEEHFFNCAECALDMKAVSAFVDGARDIFAADAEGAERDPATETASARPLRDSRAGRWKGWWQPLIAVPTFAALLLIIGYQNLRTIPSLERSASGSSMQVLNSYSLATANSRGAAAVNVAVRPGENFALDFDIPPTKGFPQYLCQLREASGRVLQQVRVSAEQANKTVELFISGGIMHAGMYTVVIAGDPDQSGQFREENQLAQLGFEVSIAK
jgi:hypothetical protein